MDASPLPSHIRSVTVFREGALVSRVAELAAGASGPVRLGGLPPSLSDGDVRARVEAAPGAAGPLPVASDLRVALEVEHPDPGLPPPDDEALRAARRAERELRGRIEQLDRELARATALLPAPRPAVEGREPPPAPVGRRLELLRFRAEARARTQAARDALALELEEAVRRRTDLEERDRRASTARQARPHELRKAAIVSIEGGPGASAATLVLEYLVPGARWSPSWALRLDASGGRGELALRAVVAQRTGEDWRGALLVLSTADAQRFVALPELASLRIGRRQAPPRRAGWRAPPRGAEALYADFDRARAALIPPRPAAPPPLEPPAPPPPPAPMPAAMPVAGAPAPGLAMPMAPPQAKAAPLRAARARAERAETTTGAAAPEDLFFGAPPAPQPARPAPPPIDPLQPGDDLLRYGALVMPAPDEPGRGRLRPAGPSVVVLAHAHVHVAFDVAVVVASAAEEARAVAAAPLPAGHRPLPARPRFAHAFPSTAPVDVPSDGAYHAVPVLAREARVRHRFVAVPREAQDVFRYLELDNPLPVPLPAGPVDVSVGPVFLLQSSLPEVGVGGRAEIGLGVEAGLRVARNTRYAEEVAGLMRGRLALSHEVRIELQSNLAEPAELEVRERVPVTREDEDDIKVVVESVDPEWAAYRPADQPGLRGGHAWRVTLAPGEARSLALRYRIEIPAKQELAGGNRRET